MVKTPLNPSDATASVVTTTTDAPAKATPSHKAAVERKPSVTPRLSAEERRAKLEEAAYRKAAQRNFEPGFELEDWLQAERELDTPEGSEGHD